MNGNMTPQRTLQRPQGAPPRPPQRPQGQPPQEKSKYSGVFLGILIGTITLLGVSLIVLCVALAMGGLDSKPGKQDESSGGGGDLTQNSQSVGTGSASGNIAKAKFLSLPSATPSGSYRSSQSAGAPTISGIQSAAAIVVDMDGNVSVGEKNADERVYPASMTKVMTLLVACENAKSATDRLTVSAEMMNYLTTHPDASVWGALNTGATLTVEDALFLINYQSDTIACLLIADYIAGSEAAFVEMMNQRAQQLGCVDTHFANTTGLHADDHYTTCRDMATIMCAAMNNPAAKKVLSSYEGYSIEGVGQGSFYATWFSDKGRLADNKWAGGGSDMAFIAGKTGYETIPTSCFVTAAKNTATGKQYVCVTVGRVNNSQPAVNNASSTRDAKYIYRYYANGETNAAW